MFGMSKKKISAKDRGLIISMTLNKYTTNMYEIVDRFILQYPEYKTRKNNIIEELQWIITASGLISVMALSDFGKANETIGPLIEFYRSLHQSNDDSPAFNNDYLTGLQNKLNRYLVCFNRGFTLRDSTQNSLNDALMDVASEAVEYITGEVRCNQDVFNLQERPTPSELELFVKDILNQFVKIYIKEFEKMKIV